MNAKRGAQYALIVLLLFSFLSMTLPASAYSVIRTSNNHFCSLQANCIYWSQTFYANQLIEGGDINFTAVSFSPTQVPSHSFGMNVTGGNLTITQINAPNIILTNSVSNGKYENTTFFYDSNTVSEVDIGSTKIYSASFNPSYGSWFSTVGNAVFQGNGYITIKTTISSQITIWFGLVDVTVNLVHASSGPILTNPDYISIGYVKGGNPQTFQAVDGPNYFDADPYSLITVTGSNAAYSSSARICLAGCTAYSLNVNIGSSTTSLNYYSQSYAGISYSISSGTPISTESPYFNYLSFGIFQRATLSTSSVSYWVDDGSNVITPQNPWFSNLQIFIPSPTTSTATTVNFAYSINGVASSGKGTAPSCNNLGTNTTALWQGGCIAPAIFYTFANVLSPPVTWALLLAAIAIPTQLTGKNLLLTFTVASFVIGFVSYATSSFLPIVSDIMFLIGAGAATATLIRLTKRGSEG